MQTSLETDLRNLWKKPIKSLPTFIDLGRLCKRIDVFVESSTAEANNKTLNDVSPSDASLESNSSGSRKMAFRRLSSTASKFNIVQESRAESLAHVIKAVASNIESKAVSKVLEDEAIPKFVTDAGDNLDYREYVEELFKTFDEDSPSVKLFKMVNQAALFVAITHMKLNIAQCATTLSADALMTKDVRTADGWRVEIGISSTSISVTHVRKEQSLGQPFAPDYWDVQWCFTVNFSPDMSKLQYSSMQVLNMEFGSKISPKVRAEIKRVYYETINNDYTYSNIEIEDEGESMCPSSNRCKCVIS